MSEQAEYEKRTATVQFKAKPSEVARWAKLWGLLDREFSYNIRRVLNAEANRVDPPKEKKV